MTYQRQTSGTSNIGQKLIYVRVYLSDTAMDIQGPMQTICAHGIAYLGGFQNYQEPCLASRSMASACVQSGKALGSKGVYLFI